MPIDGQLFGIGLGGAVEQANVQAQQDIQTRALQLQEQQFRSQEMAQQQQQVFQTAENLINQLVEAKKASGLSSEEFERRAANSIQQTMASLSRTSELAQANNINVPDFGQRLRQSLDLTQTAGEAAATTGQTEAVQQVAQATALTEFGIPSTQALEAAGVPAAQVPQLQTEIGRLISDQQRVIEQFGEDSPQAQAIAEVIQAKSQGETQPDFSDVSGLRKEFTRASEDFIATQDAFDRVKFAAENATAAGDVALIFGFMKMLDPGSTVREGEFATAQTAANVPEQVLGLYNRAVSGQRLTASQRTDFFNQSKGIFRNQLQRQVTREQEFSRLAQSFRFPAEQVIVNFREGVSPEDISFATETTVEQPQEVQERVANGFDLDTTLDDLRGLPDEQVRSRLQALPLDQRRMLLERLRERTRGQ